MIQSKQNVAVVSLFNFETPENEMDASKTVGFEYERI